MRAATRCCTSLEAYFCEVFRVRNVGQTDGRWHQGDKGVYGRLRPFAGRLTLAIPLRAACLASDVYQPSCSCSSSRHLFLFKTTTRVVPSAPPHRPPSVTPHIPGLCPSSLFQHSWPSPPLSLPHKSRMSHKLSQQPLLLPSILHTPLDL